jgi:hypothetical protein
MALRSGNSSSGRDGGPVEAAGYLSEAISELIQIAQVHRLDMLCYLLDMARLEAGEIVRLRAGRCAQRSETVHAGYERTGPNSRPVSAFQDQGAERRVHRGPGGTD